MPWNYKTYPVSMKNLPEEVRNKAIDIANALYEQGNMPEGIMIATAISRAKDWAANRGKTTDGDGKTTDVKEHGQDQYVTAYNGEWALKTEMEEKPEVFHYKKEAVKAGRKKAREAKGNLIIKDRQGRIRQKISYNPARRKKSNKE